GVDVREIAQPFATGALEMIDEVTPPVQGAPGGGAAIALDAGSVAAHRAIFQVLDAGGEVGFAAAPFTAGGQSWPAGTPVVTGLPDLTSRAAGWAAELGLRAAAVDATPATTRT